ncbi:MAG TPA: hypothetical protein VN650_08820, partial [Gemmatimonadaceae bacterium]|nr:hypothetical protein [Gemmatimonadaceae bacterium]
STMRAAARAKSKAERSATSAELRIPSRVLVPSERSLFCAIVSMVWYQETVSRRWRRTASADGGDGAGAGAGKAAGDCVVT